jgi:HAD superfamily hydrolase (TIGR01549 family)
MKANLFILDVEGTLVDCVQETLSCWQETFRHFGFELSREALHRQSGRDPDDMIRTLLKEKDAARHADALKREQGRRYREEYLPRVTVFAGVRPLFETIRQAGWQAALATSCAKDELTFYLKLTGIRDLVDAIACGEDVDREKPHPDVIEVALARCGHPDHGIMIGDTPYDAQAALAAGIAGVGLLTGGFTEGDLLKAGCSAVYRDPTHLGEELGALMDWATASRSSG